MNLSKIIISLLLLITGQYATMCLHAQRVSASVDALEIDFDIVLSDDQTLSRLQELPCKRHELTTRDRFELACYMHYRACKQWFLKMQEMIAYYATNVARTVLNTKALSVA